MPGDDLAFFKIQAGNADECNVPVVDD